MPNSPIAPDGAPKSRLTRRSLFGWASALTGLLATRASATPAGAAPPVPAPPANSAGRTYAEAWRDYLAALEEARAIIETDPACADPKVRAAALHLPAQLQAAAFYMHLAPHKGYPLLNQRHVGEPIGLNWGLPNPDFDYHWAYLDGKRRYRIHGPRKSVNGFFDMVVFNGYFIDGVKRYFQGSINDFVTADGGIEIFLGPKSDGPNHIELDPGEPHNVITIREALEDWETDRPTPLRIECVDPVETRGPFNYPEADMVARIDRAAALVRSATMRSMRDHGLILESTGGKENVFSVNDKITPLRANNNAHPDNKTAQCIYNIPRGQALILEAPMPKSVVYWGIQLGDLWWQSTDYIWHQTSLNRKNAYFGADDVFRAVVSHEDPGIQNWLDPVDNDRGRVSLRYYKASDVPQPQARLVPSGDVRKHLPPGTPRFTPEQRRKQLAARTDAGLRRFGY